MASAMAVRSATELVASPPIALPGEGIQKVGPPTCQRLQAHVPQSARLLRVADPRLLLLAAILAPLISPYDPIVQHQGKELLGPSSAFWFGTDELGRDLLSRIIFGTRPSLIVAMMVVVIGGGLGILAGLAAGYFGGWVEAILMRLFDALFAFPPVLLGFVIIAALGPGTFRWLTPSRCRSSPAWAASRARWC